MRNFYRITRKKSLVKNSKKDFLEISPENLQQKFIVELQDDFLEKSCRNY